MACALGCSGNAGTSGSTAGSDAAADSPGAASNDPADPGTDDESSPTVDASSAFDGGSSGSSTPDAARERDGAAEPDAGRGESEAGRSESDGGSSSTPTQVPAGWKLALDEDFTGSSLDKYWNMGTNQGSFAYGGTTYYDCWIPAESEYPTASMVAVADSTLGLSVMASASPVVGDQGTKSYISGYVNTYGNFAFQYGYIEIRAELPAAEAGSMTGLWPALWLFDSTYASQDEIDIVESFGGDQTSIGMTVHNAAINKTNSTGDQVVVKITPGYHVFGALHQASSVSFYVDDKLEKTFDDALPGTLAINLGMQLGNASMGWISGPEPSNWGSGTHGAHAPDLNVDWVHVWTP